ncbi:MAG: bifunctional hydroxymethylpyrimidine kinase/phosphomethylpyrimidine kinase [Candidatus Onthomorpha sp.]
MKNVSMAMTIAGSDCSGGAGVQADIKTMSALGVFASSCITALTCQNTMGVTDIMAVKESIIRGQIDAVLSDLPIKAVKIGMLFNSDICKTVSEALKANNFCGTVVLDPVMVATSGSNLASESLKDAMIKYLFPLSTLVTPNLHEAKVLAGCDDICTEKDMLRAGEKILSLGAKAVLVKGGHLEKENLKNLLIRNHNGDMVVEEFVSKKVNSRNTHGTGCSLSSAIASFCASGFSLSEAVAMATEFVHDAIVNAQDVFLGKGHGSLNHFFNPKKLQINESNS